MLSSLVLDALLVLILLMIVPIGFFRGGLREVCTSAGLMLGILLAQQWAGRWGGWIADKADVDADGTTFAVSVAVVVLVAGVVGYGSSAAFSYRPGPGGRMYGGFLALLNGMLLTGYLINAFISMVSVGGRPEVIDESYVARALSIGIEWVLLAGAIGILLATLFGMFVRERDDEAFAYGPAPLSHEPVGGAATQRRRLASAPEPEKIEPPVSEPQPNAPVRIREVRHWEGRPEPAPRQYGSGWQQTWPGAQQGGSTGRRPWEQPTARHQAPGAREVSETGTANLPQAHQGQPQSQSQNQKEILRRWMDQERPRSDE